jgi:hypothetical protein
VPSDLAFPFWIEQILQGFWRAFERHRVYVDPGRKDINDDPRPVSVLVLQVRWDLVDVGRSVGGDQAGALHGNHAVEAVENIRLPPPGTRFAQDL